MTFHVGQKVVFVADPPTPARLVWIKRGAEYPIKGSVYTIRAINDWSSGTLLRFEELRHEHLIGFDSGTIEPGFPAWAFRPVKTTDISIFEKMLTKAPSKVPA